jgi:tripartite-type tricarboxylate transporter receptor subunit TctC
VGELFQLTTNTKMVHVPYKGGAAAVIDLLTGYVTIAFTVPFPTMPHAAHHAGGVRADHQGGLRALGQGGEAGGD